MKQQLTVFLLFIPLLIHSQDDSNWKKSALVFTPEIMVGKTAESNDGFPDRKLQKQAIFNIGRDHTNNPQEWAYRLKRPKTGVGFGYTDFGNLDSLGIALTVIPFIEFNALGKENLSVLVGMGGSYFTEKFDPDTNPNNNAVTTDLTWAFRTYFYYKFYTTKNIDWRIGLGYSHHSNGHTRLLNQGYNSFLVSFSGDIHNPFKKESIPNTEELRTFDRSSYSYIDFRSGIGQNVFALAFNDPKEVYTIAGEYGKVYNNTFKLGVGFYYRYYEHYYDYIKGNESLVQDGREFESYKNNPWSNATNFGISFRGEVMLNHIGLDVQLGYNFHKPGYKIEWRINEGWDNTPREIPEFWMLGEFDTKFKLKHRISSRMGLKYYFVGTSKAPAHNFYLGAHINSNLGQADFTALSLGYVYSFNFKNGK